MECNHKKICYLCQGSFKMTRGCNLEKRCPACRVLNIINSVEKPWILVHDRALQSEGSISNYINYCAPDQTYLLREIAENNPHAVLGYNTEPDPMDIILLEESSIAIGEVLLHLTHNEEYVVKRLIMDNDERSIVAAELNLTVARIGQIANSAIKKLKHPKIGRELQRAAYGEKIKMCMSHRPSHEPIKTARIVEFKRSAEPLRVGTPDQDVMDWVK